VSTTGHDEDREWGLIFGRQAPITDDSIVRKTYLRGVGSKRGEESFRKFLIKVLLKLIPLNNHSKKKSGRRGKIV